MYKVVERELVGHEYGRRKKKEERNWHDFQYRDAEYELGHGCGQQKKNEKTQRKKPERTIFIVDEDPDVHYAEIWIGSSSDIGLEKGGQRITRKGKQGKGKKERRKRKRREKRKEGKEKKRKKKKENEEVDHTIFSIEMKNGR